MESIICKSLLWKTGLSTSEDYNRYLDEIFAKDSDNDTLLDLEFISADCDATYDYISRYWKYEYKNFSIDCFGKALLNDLKNIYKSNTFTIEDFARKCYKVYKILPYEISSNEPFFTLCYADEPLSWGDEIQCREIYEKLFEFYK